MQLHTVVSRKSACQLRSVPFSFLALAFNHQYKDINYEARLLTVCVIAFFFKGLFPHGFDLWLFLSSVTLYHPCRTRGKENSS